MELTRIQLFLSCFIVTCSAGRKSLSGFDYHAKIGIPKAKEIWESENNLGRIIGGTPSNPGALPFHAGLIITLTTGWQSVCGGTLVSNTRVLTAAHCWWDGRNQGREVTVALGTNRLFSGGLRVITTNVNTHMNWNPNSLTFDIAIITINSIQLTNDINVAALPSLSDAGQTFAGITGIASGFGKTSDAQTSFPSDTALHHVNLLIITNAVCQQSFAIPIHGSHMCTSGAGRVGTCDGDSGGPLTIIWNSRRVLVGIVSFGLGNGCESNYPSVFTRVTAFLTWIEAHM